jgi:hypothetical protein
LPEISSTRSTPAKGRVEAGGIVVVGLADLHALGGIVGERRGIAGEGHDIPGIGLREQLVEHQSAQFPGGSGHGISRHR